METLAILEELQSLVSDKLQVVSYKWLSRNFSVSSNAAKRLLQQFAEEHKNGVEVVYAVSGWVKNNPQTYHITLVSAHRLQEAREEFDGNCSIHVYSVQAAIPKDPAALWNDEFVQAEELFKQPSVVENCLRDNRFCGVFNPFVKRNVAGTAVNAASQSKSSGTPGPSRSSSAPDNIKDVHQQIKVEQSGPKAGKQSTVLVKDVKPESHGTEDQLSKPALHGGKVPLVSANEKKGQVDKNPTSLTSLWGRASEKSKVTSAVNNNSLITNPTASAEAQIGACEALEDLSSDDEARDVNFKCISNGKGGRKRRVIFHDSDDENEDTVSLATPDPPKEKINKILLSEKPNVNGLTDDKPIIKEEKSIDKAPDKDPRETSFAPSRSINSKDASREKVHNHSTKDDGNANIATSAVPGSPKRRKVLRTRIDERGREVNEVVWEGEDTDTNKADCNSTKNADSNSTKKVESNPIANTVNNRGAAAAKKSPTVAASNPGGKAGNKKKDPKQGNILSFFKKV
ncbi:uncharacterized protein LOC126670449 [Mercurialis annua]|uniref:uncharacterized protein LOC126670449 n=1 Tax=Mercurialis annua TaxID=3986 RepID=UPI00215F58FA|nr:uncharacterized protein LOC126670449 [Mercurialis annua]